jgi:ABC-type Mn2+/Zn2+ transport system ATPase subunit
LKNHLAPGKAQPHPVTGDTTLARAGISVEDVTVVRGGHTVLTNITFSVGAGTLMGVLGPNGAGKSSLFGAITGMLPLSKGKVTMHGIAALPGSLAYVPQRDSINWTFPATVIDVVSMGRIWNVGWLRQYGKRDKDVVRLCLERVNLWEQRNDRITELSGGQRQRVFIARALAQEATVILLDEAFSGVDVGAQETIVEVLRSLRDEGKIVLLATHDLTNLVQRFDSVLCINCHVCACGPPEEAFTPEVFQELYASRGAEFVSDHFVTRNHA